MENAIDLKGYINNAKGKILLSGLYITKLDNGIASKFNGDFSNNPFVVENYMLARKEFDRELLDSNKLLAVDADENNYLKRYAIMFALGGKARGEIIDKLIAGLIDSLKSVENGITYDPKIVEYIDKMRPLINEYMKEEDKKKKEEIEKEITEKIKLIRVRQRELGLDFEETAMAIKELIFDLKNLEDKINETIFEFTKDFSNEIFDNLDKIVDKIEKKGDNDTKMIAIEGISRGTDNYNEFMEMIISGWDKKEPSGGFYELVNRADNGNLDENLIFYFYSKYRLPSALSVYNRREEINKKISNINKEIKELDNKIKKNPEDEKLQLQLKDKKNELKEWEEKLRGIDKEENETRNKLKENTEKLNKLREELNEETSAYKRYEKEKEISNLEAEIMVLKDKLEEYKYKENNKRFQELMRTFGYIGADEELVVNVGDNNQIEIKIKKQNVPDLLNFDEKRKVLKDAVSNFEKSYKLTTGILNEDDIRKAKFRYIQSLVGGLFIREGISDAANSLKDNMVSSIMDDINKYYELNENYKIKFDPILRDVFIKYDQSVVENKPFETKRLDKKSQTAFIELNEKIGEISSKLNGIYNIDEKREQKKEQPINVDNIENKLRMLMENPKIDNDKKEIISLLSTNLFIFNNMDEYKYSENPDIRLSILTAKDQIHKKNIEIAKRIMDINEYTEDLNNEIEKILTEEINGNLKEFRDMLVVQNRLYYELAKDNIDKKIEAKLKDFEELSENLPGSKYKLFIDTLQGKIDGTSYLTEEERESMKNAISKIRADINNILNPKLELSEVEKLTFKNIGKAYVLANMSNILDNVGVNTVSGIDFGNMVLDEASEILNGKSIDEMQEPLKVIKEVLPQSIDKAINRVDIIIEDEVKRELESIIKEEKNKMENKDPEIVDARLNEIKNNANLLSELREKIKQKYEYDKLVQLKQEVVSKMENSEISLISDKDNIVKDLSFILVQKRAEVLNKVMDENSKYKKLAEKDYEYDMFNNNSTLSKLPKLAFKYYNSSVLLTKLLAKKITSTEAYTITRQRKAFSGNTNSPTSESIVVESLEKSANLDLYAKGDLDPVRRLEKIDQALRSLELRKEESIKRLEERYNEKGEEYQKELKEIEELYNIERENLLKERVKATKKAKVELEFATKQNAMHLGPYLRSIREMYATQFIINELKEDNKFKLGKIFSMREKRCYENALFPTGDAMERSVTSKLMQCFEKFKNEKRQRYEHFKNLRNSLANSSYSWTMGMAFLPLLALEVMSHRSYLRTAVKEVLLQDDLRNAIRRIVDKSTDLDEVDRYTKEELYNKIGFKLNIYDKDLIMDIDKYLTAKNLPFNPDDLNPDGTLKPGALTIITADIDYTDKNGNKHIGKDILIPLKDGKVLVVEFDPNNENIPKEKRDELKRVYQARINGKISKEEYSKAVLYILGLDENVLKSAKGNGLDIMQEYAYQQIVYQTFGNTDPRFIRAKKLLSPGKEWNYNPGGGKTSKYATKEVTKETKVKEITTFSR